MLQTIKTVSIILLYLTLSICIVVVTWNLRLRLLDLKITLGNINNSTESISEWVKEEKKRAEDPKNSKAIDSGIQLAAALHGTVNDFNRLVIPRINRTIDSTEASIISLNSMIEHTDASINQSLLPETTKALIATTNLVNTFSLTSQEATEAIKLASIKSGKTIDQLTDLLSDPKIKESLSNIATSTIDLDTILNDIHDTTKQMPHIMSQVDKTATNISKFSKISIIAGIISNLANGLIPGLLH